ncbi:MAG: MFS transporter [Coriobacteriia bacterium]
MTVRTSSLRRVVAARFISRAGSEAAFFVGLWGKAAFVMGATAYQLAALMFVVSAATIVGSIAGGALVDRMGPKRVLALAEVAFVPAALAMAFAQQLWLLIALAGLWALVGAPVQTAAASFAPYLTDEEDELARVNSRIEGASALAFAAGPAVGALLVRFAHVDWVFALDAVTSAIAAALVWRVETAAPVRAEDGRGALAQSLEGMRVALRLRPLRYYMLLGTVVWLAFGSFGALEPLFFRDVVGTSIEAMSWMNSFFGAGFLIGAALLPRLPKRLISARGLALFVALTGLGTSLYVGTSDLRVIAAGALLWSVVIGTMEPLLRTLLHRDSPRGAVGRIMGATETLHRAGEVVPLAFAPRLAALFGVQATLIAGGLLATAAAALSVGEAAAIDRARRPEELPVEPAAVSAQDPFPPHP